MLNFVPTIAFWDEDAIIIIAIIIIIIIQWTTKLLFPCSTSCGKCYLSVQQLTL